MHAVFRISLLRQRNTVVLRRLAILLSVLPVETGVPAFGPVAAIATVVLRGQELCPIQVALPAVGRVIAGVGRGIARVSGVQDRLGRPHTVGKRSLPRRHGGLASSQVSLTLRPTHSHASSEPPADARDTLRAEQLRLTPLGGHPDRPVRLSGEDALMGAEKRGAPRRTVVTLLIW
jgi:hypothetical protein